MKNPPRARLGYSRATGERLVAAGAALPSASRAIVRLGRQISPAPLDGVVPVQSYESGAERRGAIRNRVRAESGLGVVSAPLLIQLPRGLWLLLESQHVSTYPGGTTPPKRLLSTREERVTETGARGTSESGKARKRSYLGRREKPRHPTAKANAA